MSFSDGIAQHLSIHTEGRFENNLKTSGKAERVIFCRALSLFLLLWYTLQEPNEVQEDGDLSERRKYSCFMQAFQGWKSACESRDVIRVSASSEKHVSFQSSPPLIFSSRTPL
jgi:hypothetical protein